MIAQCLYCFDFLSKMISTYINFFGYPDIRSSGFLYGASCCFGEKSYSSMVFTNDAEYSEGFLKIWYCLCPIFLR